MARSGSEILWSIDSEICTLSHCDGRYELLLCREDRLVCLLAVESEDVARTFAQHGEPSSIDNRCPDHSRHPGSESARLRA